MALHKFTHTFFNSTAEGKVTSRLQWRQSRVFLLWEISPLWKYDWINYIFNSFLCSLIFSLAASPSLPLPTRLPLPPLPLFCLLTCLAPFQPLPLSAAGVGEGEGEPGGADGALLQGAAGTSRLWQHQERRHARADVRQPLKTLSVIPSFVFCSFSGALITREGCILMLCCGIFVSLHWVACRRSNKVKARLHSSRPVHDSQTFYILFEWNCVSPLYLSKVIFYAVVIELWCLWTWSSVIHVLFKVMSLHPSSSVVWIWATLLSSMFVFDLSAVSPRALDINYLFPYWVDFSFCLLSTYYLWIQLTNTVCI